MGALRPLSPSIISVIASKHAIVGRAVKGIERIVFERKIFLKVIFDSLKKSKLNFFRLIFFDHHRRDSKGKLG